VTSEITSLSRFKSLNICLSGAGPTILALARSNYAVIDEMQNIQKGGYQGRMECLEVVGSGVVTQK
jgi:homoserine kinase